MGSMSWLVKERRAGRSIIKVRPKKKRTKEEEAWARTWVWRYFTNDELEEKKVWRQRERRKKGIAAGRAQKQKGKYVRKGTNSHGGRNRNGSLRRTMRKGWRD